MGALGDDNVLGIMLVAFAQGSGQSFFLAGMRHFMGQEQIWQETHSWHFGLLSATLAACLLTLYRDSPLQPVVWAALLGWFVTMACIFALGSTATTKGPSKSK